MTNSYTHYHLSILIGNKNVSFLVINQCCCWWLWVLVCVCVCVQWERGERRERKISLYLELTASDCQTQAITTKTYAEYSAKREQRDQQTDIKAMAWVISAFLQWHFQVPRFAESPVRQVFFSFFLPEPTFSADSLTVSVEASCAVACINICAHVKEPKHWQPYLCLDTRKHRTHR